MGLDEVMEEVVRLRKDLFAQVCVAEAKTHVGPKRVRNTKHVHYSFDEEPAFIIKEDGVITDVPAKFAPDMARVGPARERLIELYESCSFFSARYSAGLALHARFMRPDLCELDEELDGMVSELSAALKGGCGANAVADLSRLFDISKKQIVRCALEEAYLDNPCHSVRVLAGKGLGYPGLRIFLHEHLLGIAMSVSFAVFAGYLVYSRYWLKDL